MWFVSAFFWVFSLLFPITGCNEVSPPTTAPLSLSIAGSLPEAAVYEQALEGVQACEGDFNCAVSDPNGKVTLAVPVDQEIFFILQKEGYDSGLWATVVPPSGLNWRVNMDADELQAELYNALASPYPRLGTGEIYIAITPGIAGATFDLTDATGKAFYQVGRRDDISYRLDLEATTSDGRGGFVEVPPGTHRVKLGGAAEGCVPTTSGWADDNNSFRIPVREGHLSWIFVSCPPP